MRAVLGKTSTFRDDALARQLTGVLPRCPFVRQRQFPSSVTSVPRTGLFTVHDGQGDGSTCFEKRIVSFARGPTRLRVSAVRPEGPTCLPNTEIARPAQPAAPSVHFNDNLASAMPHAPEGGCPAPVSVLHDARGN